VAQLLETMRQKPVGSIPDGVIKIFHRLTPSGRAVADKVSTEISIMDTSWGGGLQAAGA
jgi:hypothetical protein